MKSLIPFGYLEKGSTFKNMRVVYCESLTEFIEALKVVNVKHAALFQIILNESMMPIDYVFLKYM